MDSPLPIQELDDYINAQWQATAPSLSLDDFFVLFTAEQVTRDYGLRLEDLQDGLVGRQGDTSGVDAIYLLVNDVIVRKDGWYSRGRGLTRLKVILLAGKPRTAFEPKVIERAYYAIVHLLTPNRDLQTLRGAYSAHAILIAQRYHQIVKRLGADKIQLQIQVVYASKADLPDQTTRYRVEQMRHAIGTSFPDAEFTFDFVGAEALLRAINEQPKGRLLPISGEVLCAPDRRAYICLVKIGDYYRFISRNGMLERRLFEANVRDYQGRKMANKAILHTLVHPGEEDFWWLNNGVTIIARRATLSDQGIHIVKPEIVNGLQTSFTLYEYCSRRGGAADDPRTIMIRVIAPREDATHELIIRATNNQTPIPPDAFRALDKLQRNIELFLLDYGIYYDRRDQYYHNESKPVEKIITVRQLAQSLTALLLGRPELAYSRPAYILATDGLYQNIFHPDYPFQIYYTAIALTGQIEQIMQSPRLRINVEPSARLMMRYHALWFSACKYANRATLDAQAVASLPPQMPEKFLVSQIMHVLRRFRQRGASNAAAKSTALLETLIRDLHGSGVR